MGGMEEGMVRDGRNGGGDGKRWEEWRRGWKEMGGMEEGMVRDGRNGGGDGKRWEEWRRGS